MTPSQTPEILQQTLAFHHGQLDCRLVAVQKGTQLGFLDYSVFEECPYIKMVAVQKDARRKGIAASLVIELQRLHPDQEIVWGMTTDDGEALRLSLEYRAEVNAEVISQKNELDSTNQNLARLQNEASIAREQGQEQYQAFIGRESDKWNDLSDRRYELEELLSFAKESKQLVVGKKNQTDNHQKLKNKRTHPSPRFGG